MTLLNIIISQLSTWNDKVIISGVLSGAIGGSFTYLGVRLSQKNHEKQSHKDREIILLKEEFNEKKKRFIIITEKWIDLKLKVNEFYDSRYQKNGLINKVFSDKNDMLFIRYKKQYLELKNFIDHIDAYFGTYIKMYLPYIQDGYQKHKNNIFELKNKLLDYDRFSSVIIQSFDEYLNHDYEFFLEYLNIEMERLELEFKDKLKR